MENTILTFDICSSTSIIEDLHRTGTVANYMEIIENIIKFLKKNENKYSFKIYKFLGDGFILIFDENVDIDSILEFSVILTNDSNISINKFVEKYIETSSSLPRKGITTGIDKGKIEKRIINNVEEYIGRPINSACRLQTSLNEDIHVNKVLISKKIYNQITEEQYKILCSPTSRKFKNLSHNERVDCYEFNPIYFIFKDNNSLREPLQNKIKNKNTEILLDQFRDGINQKVIASTIFENIQYNFFDNELKIEKNNNDKEN